MIAVVLVIMWLYALETWTHSALITIASIPFIYPVLFLLSKIPGLTRTFNARKKGEYGISFVVLAVTYTTVIALCWGLCGERLLAVASFLAWGPGDAAAALIGKKIGNHRIGKGKVKSLEGSAAMLTLSLICVFTVLMIDGGFSIPVTVLVSIITAIVTTIVEFYVLNGFDTFFCPASAAVVLTLSYFLFR
jgi:dolichol kinase